MRTFRALRQALLLAAVFLSAPAWAAQRVELKDVDQDGFKETRETYENGALATVELDKNKDGKFDKKFYFEKGMKVRSEADTDFNGVVESWVTYDSAGKMALLAKDSNADGKPDKFQKMLKGPQLLLKEYDMNFDGRIDHRKIVEWTMIRYSPGTPKTPGYRNVMREEDSDYDGKIDLYREKGNKDPKKKIGEPMDPKHAEKDPDKPKPAAAGGGGGASTKDRLDRLIDTMNERYGLEDIEGYAVDATDVEKAAAKKAKAPKTAKP
ncbi:MAG TPA: hypothetical protein VL404_06195 [Candidatus Eisenbacteria bacterium]|nr:hypothetical protein [Candidatus Eisenbacteria bacterium]